MGIDNVAIDESREEENKMTVIKMGILIRLNRLVHHQLRERRNEIKKGCRRDIETAFA